jgi:hypothetical protein
MLEVDDIKFRRCFFGIFFIVCLILSLFLSNGCIAEDPNGVHFIGEPTYRLLNTIKRGNSVIGKTYEINITLKNGGTKKSDFLIVNLSDDSSSLKQIIRLEPDEKKNITFTWSTINLINQKLLIKFYPEDVETVRTKFNTGSTSITIKTNENDELTATSTPGFEAFILLILLFALIIYRKIFFKN